MPNMHPRLLSDIETFLAETGMGESYFGKLASGNSELVLRLRSGGRVWPETEAKVRSFIKARRKLARASKRGRVAAHVQGTIVQHGKPATTDGASQ